MIIPGRELGRGQTRGAFQVSTMAFPHLPSLESLGSSAPPEGEAGSLAWQPPECQWAHRGQWSPQGVGSRTSRWLWRA